jgi:hypothetical protein
LIKIRPVISPWATVGAETLASDDKGEPVFTMFPYGKGKVFFMSLPLEKSLLDVSDAFKAGHYRFYETITRHMPQIKIAKISNPNISMTEHIINDKKRMLVLVNYNQANAATELELADKWSIGRLIYGEMEIGTNDAAVIEIIREGS